MEPPLRIALLSYRAHPEVGGQGVYVRNLSDALVSLGHRVTVFAGQPYPELSPGVELRTLPSLDLYQPEDPFRRPSRSEFRGPVDVFEYATMCVGGFPEPLTFSLRAARALSATEPFDVVHDNQCLGYGLLRIARQIPTVATIHHPISIDRRMAIDAAEGWAKKLGQRRWYGFVRMQARVARRLPSIVTVSEQARDDVIGDFGVSGARISVIHNGVDAELFRPLHHVRQEAGRVVTIASSDQASKGLDVLLEAVAKLRTEREDVRLTIVGRGGEGSRIERSIERFGLEGIVDRPGRVETLKMVELLGSAQVGVVPSLYEGFSLPAIEMMSCGVPLVSTTGGALPEVVGDAALTVAPGDAGAMASAIGSLLDDAERRSQLARAGRERVLERFTWRSAASEMAVAYRKVIDGC